MVLLEISKYFDNDFWSLDIFYLKNVCSSVVQYNSQQEIVAYHTDEVWQKAQRLFLESWGNIDFSISPTFSDLLHIKIENIAVLYIITHCWLLTCYFSVEKYYQCWALRATCYNESNTRCWFSTMKKAVNSFSIKEFYWRRYARLLSQPNIFHK